MDERVIKQLVAEVTALQMVVRVLAAKATAVDPTFSAAVQQLFIAGLPDANEATREAVRVALAEYFPLER